MKDFRSRHPRSLPAKPTASPATLPTVSEHPTIPRVEPVPLLHHLLHKHSKKPSLSQKDLPPTPIETQPPTLEISDSSPVNAACRTSSVYSRPQTSWERPSWWEGPEDHHAADEDIYMLPSTVYRDEASRMLEGVDSPARTYSPLIPEPSPSPTEGSQSARQSIGPIRYIQRSTTESGEHRGGLLPPTPESLHHSHSLWHQTKLATRPTGSSDNGGSAHTKETSWRGSPVDMSWYNEEESDSDGASILHGLGISSIALPSTDSLPRGRTRQRSLPSYFHREQNYVRNSDERLSQPSTPISDLGLLDDVQWSTTHDEVAPAPSHGTAKLEAADMVKKRKAKTLSEAYHKLLLEEYQDLAADGRAWVAFTEPADLAAPNAEVDGRDIKLVPEPLFYSVKGQPGAEAHPRNMSTSTSSAKSRVPLSSLRGILPGKLRRNDSVTSGDVMICGPPDTNGGALSPVRSSPKTRHKLWGKKEPNLVHTPPLPLYLPDSVSKSPRVSSDRSRTSASRGDGSPASHRLESPSRPEYRGSDRTVMPLPLPLSSKAYDVLAGHEAPNPRHKPSSSTSSDKTAWSFLDRMTGIHDPSHVQHRQSGGNLGSGNGYGSVANWYGKAKDSVKSVDKARRRRELKRSIRFVGQVDPRNVETLGDTTRRLAYASGQERDTILGEG